MSIFLLHARPLILFYLLFPLVLSAQPDLPVFTRIPGAAFGIPEMTINEILKDRDGFFWLATRKGLIRFDGYEMKTYWYNPADSNSIGSNRIIALAEDEEGFLWIGTTNDGVSRYDKYADVFTNFIHDPRDTNSLCANGIEDLLVDSRGRLWIATVDGLDRMDRHSGRIIHYRNRPGDPNSLSGDHINCLVEDAMGRIWIGTENNGLNCLEPETGILTRFTHTRGLPGEISDRRIIRMARDAEGFLWASMGDARLNRIDPRTLNIQHYSIYPDDQSNNEMANVRPILPDPRGGLWLGTWGKGLVYFHPETGKTIQYGSDPADPASLANDGVNALWMDDNRNLWIAHLGPGLSRLATDASGFRILPLDFEGERDFIYPAFQCITEDSHGRIWMGTHGNGLYRYDPATGETSAFRRRPGDPKSLANNIVWDILEDGNGAIWVATHGGLQRWDNGRGTFTSFPPDKGPEDLPVSSLLEDHSGKLWIGSFGGLYQLDPDKEKICLSPESPKKEALWIRTIYADSRQNLWLAAFNEGVYRLDPNTGERTFFQKKRNQANGLSNNSVSAIAEDAQGRIWLGTEGGGLNLFLPHQTRPDSSAFRHWRPYNSSLPDENIFSITIDNNNRLWLSTDAGLFSFNPEDQNFTPHLLPGTIKGLNARAKPGKNGVVYVGNAQFAYRFHPDSLRKNPQAPPVFITDLQIEGRYVPVRNTFGDSLSTPSPLDRSILYTSSLELEHWQNDLTFTFSALNYLQPEDNRYRYQLEGYENDWMKTDASNRSIRYTNLSPGQYTFRVIASNNEDVWNMDGKSIRIKIHPPWWRSWWAYTFYVLSGLALLAAVRKFELNRRMTRAQAQKQEEINQLRTKLYTNITHEFRTPLTLILGMADRLKDQVSEQAKDGLQLIRRNGRLLLQLVNQMLDLSKLEAGHLKLNYEQGDIINYLQYLVESYHSYAESRRIRLHFLSDLPSFDMDYDPVRLMHVLSNLLSNAIKFSPEGKDVYISVARTGQTPANAGSLEIKVKDTGIGIPEEKLPHIFDRFYQVDDSSTRKGEGTGIGLTLTRELVCLMGGEISVESKPGKGSVFSVILPVTRQSEKRSGLPEKGLTAEPAVPATFNIFTPPTGKRTAKPLLLIVEDNADMVRYLVNSFNPAYQLEVAYNGQQGIDKALSLIPDIIITDVMMPEKDGFELCATLKNHELTSHIPIIMLTAKVDVESRLTGLKRGADVYLEKPFLQEELEVRIGSLLTQRQKMQAYYRRRAGISDETETIIPSEADSAPEHEFLKRVNEVIEANLGNPGFTVGQLSKALFVHPSNLYRKLTALTGENPNQYIRSFRLARAKELLADPANAITTVALETGFRSPEYFSRVFKKEVGMTPSDYRKERG